MSVLWLYNRTGDASLLELARLLHAQGHDWIAQFADFQLREPVTAERIKAAETAGLKEFALSAHGVNIGQAIKAGPVWSLLSGSKADRAAVLQMIADSTNSTVCRMGCFPATNIWLDPIHRKARSYARLWSICSPLSNRWQFSERLRGDRLERLAFNTLPGAMTDDMWAHQYNQEPNQVECSLHHKPWTTDGPESICLVWSRTSAAAQRISTKGGPSLQQASSCFPMMMASQPLRTLPAR